jgi:hypothetical protein
MRVRTLAPRFSGVANLLTRSLRKFGRSRSVLGFPRWKVPISRHQDSRFHDSRFPEMGNYMTRGICHSDG